MKKLVISLLMVAAFAVGQTANAAIIERSDDGDLTINVFASIIESFRVTIDNDDIQLAGPAPIADGLLDLNGGMAGFDGLQSVAGNACADDTGATPVYADPGTTCTLDNGGNASLSALQFQVDMDLKVELSGPGDIDVTASLQGTSADAPFDSATVQFVTAGSASISGMIDQDGDTLRFYGEAPFNGGPNYDDTIVVSVTKN